MQEKRADYGKAILSTLSKQLTAVYGENIVQALFAQLTAEYGRGYGQRNLFKMVRFAEVIPDGEIVATLSRQSSWRHFVELILLDDPLNRDFYAKP